MGTVELAAIAQRDAIIKKQADEIERLRKAIEQEREACAKVAEDMLPGYKGRLIEAFDDIAAAIRARSSFGDEDE